MPFEPGKSGCPGGPGKRSDQERLVQRLAREHTVRALNRLVAIIDSENEKAAVAACNAVLDRGWGKPTQQVQLQDEAGLPIGITVSYGRLSGDPASTEARPTLHS